MQAVMKIDTAQRNNNNNNTEKILVCHTGKIMFFVHSAGEGIDYSGLRPTMRYIGVNNFLFPPATRQSPAHARLSAVF